MFLQWKLSGGIFVVEPSLWDLRSSIVVVEIVVFDVESLLLNLCCGIFVDGISVVESLLWCMSCPCSGILYWILCCGICVVESLF